MSSPISGVNSNSAVSAYTPTAQGQQQKQAAKTAQSPDTVQLSPKAKAAADAGHDGDSH
jgi:hypothetical protein